MGGRDEAQAGAGAWDAIHRAIQRLARFFGVRIWMVRLVDLRPGRALLYRGSRIAYSTVRGFRENRLTFRAAALTYFTVLSIVPFLAFAFSVLKGFGAYRSFVDGFIRPYIAATFGPNPALRTAIEKVLDFVEHTDVSSLGTVGLLFLLYTSISLLSSVESVLNAIWGAKRKRPFLRQVTDYTTLLVTTPLLFLVAITFATAAQSSGIVAFLRHQLALGLVIDFFLRLSSLLVTCLAMVILYLILPNVRTRISSALLGGLLSGVLWQISLILHVQFQVGVARYNALYAGFGAIPIFMVWTYVSWLVVLLGAQLAAGHQNEQTMRQMLRARHADQALKEWLAVAITAHLARRFVRGGSKLTALGLADRLEVPALAIEDIVESLMRADIVAKSVAGTEIVYLPARDLDNVRVEDVREALRRDPQATDLRAAVEQQLGPRLRALLGALEQERRQSRHNLTLRALADLVDDGAEQLRAEQPVVGEAVLDAKQPEVPG